MVEDPKSGDCDSHAQGDPSQYFSSGTDQDHVIHLFGGQGLRRNAREVPSSSPDELRGLRRIRPFSSARRPSQFCLGYGRTQGLQGLQGPGGVDV